MIRSYMYLLSIMFASILIFALPLTAGYSTPYSGDSYNPSGYDSYSYSSGKTTKSYIKPTSSTFSASANGYDSIASTQTSRALFNQEARASESSSNFDSSNKQYDYRGPMFERQIVYLDDFAHDQYSKSKPFSSSNSNTLRHTIKTTVNEKYMGSTESMYANTQNKRSATATSSQKTNAASDEGFSFAKQRVFDSSEYSKDSYTKPYYYRPIYNDQKGYYNWN